jgi:hypothetical protein
MADFWGSQPVLSQTELSSIPGFPKQFKYGGAAPRSVALIALGVACAVVAVVLVARKIKNAN